MHVPAWLQLKRAGVFISRLLNVDGIPISLWAVAWWTHMQSVGAWKMLGVCSTRVPMHGKSKLPNLKGVHAEQQRLSGLVCDAGYVPCVKLVLNDVEGEGMVFHLSPQQETGYCIWVHQHSSW
jgi:hypothetical protein